jgi:ABC-type multidrug transport system ATPase subunit
MRPSESTSPAVEMRAVTCRYGAKVALDNVSLTVPTGSVLGLVGENGAGKTTLIKHILGLLRPKRGSVTVFGRDPVGDPVGVLSRVGYLSEEADLPGWMRVGEVLRYSRAFYPTWDEEYAERLRRDFDLDPNAPVKTLSKGQRARAGLMVALSYRPDLLVLDEPSSGLDPIVRRDILSAIIRTIADEGRTVLFSSHLLGEVERVSDQVAMLRSGRLVFCGPLDDVQQTHSRIVLRFDEPRLTSPALEGALVWEGSGRDWSAVWSGAPSQLEAAAAVLGARVIERRPLSLDEIFIARAGAVSPPAGGR